MRSATESPSGSKAWRRIASVAGLLFVLALQLLATTANWNDVLLDGRVYFIDADCYSRMTRVAAILDGGPWSVRAHDFENWPTGVRPHTTAGLDLLIAGGAMILMTFGVTDAMDLSGAWISPALGAATLIGLWMWGGWMRLRFRWEMLVLLAVSPVVAQAFKFGRPDHQSLVFLMLAAGLAVEAVWWSRRAGSRRWILAWGITWGAALWVSLYEPAILLAIILVTRTVAFRRAAWNRAAVSAIGLVAVTYTLSWILDGWRFGPSDPNIAAFFPRWSLQIGELANVSLTSGVWFTWAGWTVVAILPALVWHAWMRRDREVWIWISLFVCSALLTVWQLRWGCYFVLIAAMSVPAALDCFRVHRVWVSVAFLISLWPVAASWSPTESPAQQAASDEKIAERIQLRQVAEALRDKPDGGILAPWWLTPPLVYWSGKPGVAGSSHQSLPGIVDTARFFLSDQPHTAREILTRRKVAYVVLDDPERTLGTSASLLDKPIPSDALGQRAFAQPRTVEDQGLHLVGRTPFFILFETNLPSAGSGSD